MSVVNGFNVEDPRVVETTYRVIYADTDQMGIVYHGTYLQFFERGRNAYVRSSDFTHAEIDAKGYILPLVESTLRYRTPARFDDLVSIRTLVRRVSRLKVSFEYEIFKPENDGGEPTILVAVGTTVHGCLDKELKPARISADWRERLLRTGANA